MATPNNFRITNAIGTTDNFAGAEVQFLHITLITADGSTVLDVRNELGYDETMHNITRTVLQRGTIIYQRIDNAATGRVDIFDIERVIGTYPLNVALTMVSGERIAPHMKRPRDFSTPLSK